jgi:Tfp pilus assembly protein FimT
MVKKYRNSGLTLVELLITVAIIVLLIAVMITFVFPSDDRRCRLEAERLSAFLTEVSSEALISGSPSRAGLDIGKGTALREITRETASLTEQLWETGLNKKEHTVREPVTIDEVDTPQVPNQQSGRAFLIFAGTRTEGGVVVLKLNQAIYSVVVPPGQGVIRVEEGRAVVNKGLRGDRPSLPSMAGYDGKVDNSEFPTVGMPASVPMTPRPPPPAGKPKVSRNSKKNRTGTSPREVDTSPRDFDDNRETSQGTGSGSSFGGGSVGTGINVSSSNAPSGNPPAASPNNPSCPNGNCMTPPDGKTFRLDNATVTEPNALQSLLEPILNDLIATGKLLLLVRLNRPSSWLIQGIRKGAGYGNSDNFPTYRGESAPIYCSQANCTTALVPDTGEDHEITLFIRDQNIDEDSGLCLYQNLSLVDVRVNVEVTMSNSAIIEVKGTIRDSTARTFGTPDGQTLKDILENNGVEKNADTVGDGLPDSWEFSFFGYGNQVLFTDNPAANSDRTPANCEQSN